VEVEAPSFAAEAKAKARAAVDAKAAARDARDAEVVAQRLRVAKHGDLKKATAREEGVTDHDDARRQTQLFLALLPPKAAPAPQPPVMVPSSRKLAAPRHDSARGGAAATGSAPYLGTSIDGGGVPPPAGRGSSADPDYYSQRQRCNTSGCDAIPAQLQANGWCAVCNSAERREWLRDEDDREIKNLTPATITSHERYPQAKELLAATLAAEQAAEMKAAESAAAEKAVAEAEAAAEAESCGVK
jgi:hypothetical protein